METLTIQASAVPLFGELFGNGAREVSDASRSAGRAVGDVSEDFVNGVVDTTRTATNGVLEGGRNAGRFAQGAVQSVADTTTGIIGTIARPVDYIIKSGFGFGARLSNGIGSFLGRLAQ